MRILLIIIALAYVISPYDLVPDFFLGPGWIDDLLLVAGLWWYIDRLKKTARLKAENQTYRRSFEAGAGYRASTPQSPYEILGVDKDATQEQIKIAYRSLAEKYHPDKVNHLGDEFKDLAEIRFKEIQNAYQELKIR